MLLITAIQFLYEVSEDAIRECCQRSEDFVYEEAMPFGMQTN